MNEREQYIQIIKNAQKENRKKRNGVYYELHHILPKALFPLWKNRKEKQVLLTGEEHFICHQLLIKIYNNTKMHCALHRMMFGNNKKNYNITPEEYKLFRLKHSEKMKLINLGIKRSEETKKKVSENHADVSGINNPNHKSKGGKWNGYKIQKGQNNEWRKLKGWKELHPNNKGEKNPMYGKSAQIGKHWYNNGLNNYYGYECPVGYKLGRIRHWKNQFGK